MTQEIIPIELRLPFRTGSVNCYLVKTDNGFILVDTGSSSNCRELESRLDQLGCNYGNLHLILLTHGDFDHSGNAAYLRNKFDSKIAIHAEDSPMVERGNMFLTRKKGNFLQSWIVKTMFGFEKSQRFTPDLEITDGFSLTEYGLDARVIHIPGHSKGSIGILTVDGTLICGDLFESTDGSENPKLNSLMDDLESANNSIDKLKNLKINTIYPGHGQPFTMDMLSAGYSR
ncbi:MAG: MBL fold metallo-hydrolase [Dehalococcoidales bacterium]|nr:MAG: MBL fold metallo-hydrolase [Dehalococcoidales bacterium]